MAANGFRYVGKSIPRHDGPDKVSGKCLYLADLDSPGAWEAGVLRSPVAAGRLKKIGRDPAFDWNRVAVVTAADIPGANAVHMIRDDYEALAGEKITYATQALALVAAPDKSILAAALAALKPDIEPVEPALTIEDALALKSSVWGDTNVMDEFHVDCGDVEKGFAEADIIIENTFRTPLQEHIYLENCGMAAWPTPDGVEVAGSLQCPHYVRGAVAMALGLDAKNVKVRQTVTGGAFGGKEDYPSVMGVWVALLAKKCGKPVRLLYDRMEDMLVTPKRHPSKTVHKMGMKRDGTITAVDIDLILDGGANTTMSKVVLARATLHATCAYKVPNARIRGRAVATNTPPNGAFRGFGAPQSIYAMERQMDIAAAKLALDPYEIRKRNVLRKGDAFPFGQVLEDGASGELVLDDAVKRSDYLKKHAEYAKQDGRIRKGVGLSLCLHGGGFTGAGEDRMGTAVEVEYTRTGIIEVLSGSTDMGQGADTVLPMFAAEVLGLPIERVVHPLPDTSVAPNSGPTAASRTTMFVGRVTIDAARDLVGKMKAFVEEKKRVAPVQYCGDAGAFQFCGKTVATFDETARAWLAERGRLAGRAVIQPADPKYAWDEVKFHGTAYKGYSWMAQVLEAEVDLDTYEIHPLHATISTEVGRAINPVQVDGQMAGGVLQSYGMGYLEDLTFTPEGKYSAKYLNAYLIPTTLDAPEYDVKVFEDPSPFGAFGAKGIGELSCDGGASAVAAAVDHACGVYATEAPLTGEKLFNLLEAGAPAEGRA